MKLPESLIAKNPQFNRKEQKLIITALLTKINLTIKRSSVVELKLRKFGTIHTHRNRKRMSKLKYSRRISKKKWAEKQAIDRFTTKNLLW